jgi:hypothetical protein
MFGEAVSGGVLHFAALSRLGGESFKQDWLIFLGLAPA